MGQVEKYQGIIPAFYACYDKDGKVSEQRTRALARHWKTCPAEWRTFMDQKVVF